MRRRPLPPTGREVAFDFAAVADSPGSAADLGGMIGPAGHEAGRARADDVVA